MSRMHPAMFELVTLALDLAVMPLCMMHIWNSHVAPFFALGPVPFLTMVSLRVMLTIGFVSLVKLRINDIRDTNMLEQVQRLTAVLERAYGMDAEMPPYVPPVAH